MKRKYSRSVNKLSKEDKRKGRALLENGELDYPYCRLRWRQVLGEKLYAIVQDHLLALPGGQPIQTFTADDNITYEIHLQSGKYYGWSVFLSDSDVRPQYAKQDLLPCTLPSEAKYKLAKMVNAISVVASPGQNTKLRPQWTANAKRSVAGFYNSFRSQNAGVANIKSVYEAYTKSTPHLDIKSLSDFERCVGACKKGKPPLIGSWNKTAKNKASKK